VLELKVGELISEADWVEASETVASVVGRMREKELYEVFVKVGERFAMVTLRSVLSKRNLKAKLSEVMVRVPNLSPEDELVEAAKVMSEYRIRSVPVVKDGKLLGCVSVKSIVELLSKGKLASIEARKFMTPEPITVRREDKVAKARNLMVSKRIDHLPVTDGMKLEGILTSSDIVFKVLAQPEKGKGGGKMSAGITGKRSRLNIDVGGLMDEDPLTCGLRTPLKEVYETMKSRNSSYSLVTMMEELQGIITYRDFMKLIREEGGEEVPVYITGLPDTYEAGLVEEKFRRAVGNLAKSFPGLLEAKSTVKYLEGKRRYSVSAMILMKDGKRYHYSLEGYDLLDMYDELAAKVKRILGEKPR